MMQTVQLMSIEDYSKQQVVLKAPNKAQVWMVVLQNMKVKDLISSQNI